MKQAISRKGMPGSLVLAGAIMLSGLASAQAPYPSKPVRFLVGFAPGGGTDIVARTVPVKSVKELIALARKRPGEMFALMAGVRMLHVPFRGGTPSAAAIIGGEVGVGFNTMPVALPCIQSGRMRALATTEDRRASVLPEVPTIVEAGVPGYAASTWYGAVLPAGTPREIVMRLNAEINKVLQVPDVRERLLSLGAVTLGGTPEAFGTLIATDVAKFAGVVKAANMQVG